MAFYSEDTSRDWAQCRIQLNTSLMWAILQYKVSSSETAFCFPNPSIVRGFPHDEAAERMETDQNLEISITGTPPAVMVDPAVSHDAKLPPDKASPMATGTINSDVVPDVVIPNADSFMFDTSWLWTDSSGFSNIEDGSRFPSDPINGSNPENFSTWWNFGNL